MSVKWYGDKVETKINEAIEVGLTAAGIEIQGAAKQLINNYPAIDTGRLENSIIFKTRKFTIPMGPKAKSEDQLKSKPDSNEVIIGTAVYYAPYVEFGTVKMKPRSFLRRALDENKQEVNDIFQREFKRVLND